MSINFLKADTLHRVPQARQVPIHLASFKRLSLLLIRTPFLEKNDPNSGLNSQFRLPTDHRRSILYFKRVEKEMNGA